MKLERPCALANCLKEYDGRCAPPAANAVCGGALPPAATCAVGSECSGGTHRSAPAGAVTPPVLSASIGATTDSASAS
eukprot:scaffold245383_cov35-Tisochrysis_lutea.AAC.6